MCIVCVMWNKKQMNTGEALNALAEIVATDPHMSTEELHHAQDVLEKLSDAESMDSKTD